MNARPPNMIIVTTDQQRVDSMGCYGSAWMKTPHLDKLAAGGVVFDRAYCANSVCTPSRASLFSGRYLSRHGAWNVGTHVPEDTVMLSHRLAAADYRTHYVGKAHFQPHGPDSSSKESIPGWRDRYPQFKGPYYGFQTVELSLGHGTYGLAGHYGAWLRTQVSEARLEELNQAAMRGAYDFSCNACDWSLPAALHSSVWTAERAITFLREEGRRRPFLLAVGFQDPHHPHVVPRDYTGRVSPSAVPLPAWQPGELDDKPPHFITTRQGKIDKSEFRGEFKVAGQGSGYNFADVAEQDAREARAYYYTMVQLIDREMGRLLAALEAEGLAENTIVVFTTDHGELLGDHGLWMKGPYHYEQLIRVPLLMRWPVGMPAGRRSSACVSLVDVVPTLMALAGCGRDAELDGCDICAAWSDAGVLPRSHVVVETVDDPAGLREKTVVTATRKLSYYHNQPFGELYDLEKDPSELRNCWDDAAYAPDKARLMGLLLDHMEPLERRESRSVYA
jgi:arylsulfatase A-like enzyme